MSITLRKMNIARHSLDFVLFVGLCFAVYALNRWGKPQRRGFFCGDESLQYPYRANTVDVKALVSVVLSVPLLVILAVEFLLPRRTSSVNGSQPKTNKNDSCGVCQRLARCYANIGYYLFGMALTIICTSITKLSIGRLRPHFFAVCQPLIAGGTSCNDAINWGRYIMDYNCTRIPNVTDAMLKDVGLSFPSGHASIFFYAMTFVALYLQVALKLQSTQLFKHVLQFACIMMAWYASLTRISDYMHHWSDVAAGTAIGCTCAFAVALFVARFFRQNTWMVGTELGHVERGGQPTIRPSPGITSTQAAAPAAPVLPVYTFGNMPYMPYTAATSNPHYQYPGTNYQNFGYVQ